MFSRFYNLYQIFRESLFYVPTIISIIYMGVSVGLFEVDTNYLPKDIDLSFLFGGNAREARDLINVLLSSMMTMTTLVVSVTMVVINLSASQLGPRIIRSILKDTQIKIFTGFFIGSVVACFVTASNLYQLGESQNVPILTISFVFTACLFNLFILLAYVHHIAHLSVADSLLTKVHNDLINAISKLESYDETKQQETRKALPKTFAKNSKHVRMNRQGYLQTIDYNSLKNCAEENGLCIKVKCKAGDYVLNGYEIASISPASHVTADIEKKIVNGFVCGDNRTGSQDIEYSVRHLVEVGLRALSPGINDNYTAITVLNKLTGAIAELFNKNLPQNAFTTKEGKLLVSGKRASHGDVIFEAYSRILTAGADKPDILYQFLQSITVLIPLARPEDSIEQLTIFLKSIEQHIENLQDTQNSAYLQKSLDAAKSLL